MIPYAFRILQQYYIEFQSKDSVTHFRILSTCVMLSFKAVCQEMAEKNSAENKICVKKV